MYFQKRSRNTERKRINRVNNGNYCKLRRCDGQTQNNAQ